VPVTIELEGRTIMLERSAKSGGFTAAQLPVEAPPAPPLPTSGPNAAHRDRALVALAYGRSATRATTPISASSPADPNTSRSGRRVTEEAVAQYFAHRIQGKGDAWRCRINGFNFLLRQALGGGGMASLKADPCQAFAQMLLDMPVRVPASLAQKLAA